LPADRNRWAGAGIESFIAKPVIVDKVLQLVSELARQPSGAWAPDPGESEFALEAIPGNAPDFLRDEAETNGFAEACAPDSDEHLLREINQGAETVSCLVGIEASYDNSDDSGPAANVPLSAPAGLALLEAAGEWTQPSPSPAPPPVEPADPFAQARKSLSKSSFGIRVIHNDGDPSERDLI
jgi:hypothetical protein